MSSKWYSLCRYAWRESPCPVGVENCAIYSASSAENALALPAPPFIRDRSDWTFVVQLE